LEFNSYTADQSGNATLINTMQVKRTKPHSVPSGYEDIAPQPLTMDGCKYIRNGQLFIRRDGKVYNVVGQNVR